MCNADKWVTLSRDSVTDSTPSSPRSRPVLDLLFLVGLISLGEMAYWTYTKEITRYRVIGWEFLWMIPAAYTMLGGLIALAGLLVRVKTGRWPASLVVALIVWWGMSGWLRVGVKSLQPIAALILALGIGVQAGRFATRYSALWRRAVDILAPIVILVTLGLATAAFVAPKWTEHRVLASLPAVAPRSPNVLLIVMDTVRADALGSGGYARLTTPHLDAFAKRGVAFTQALSTSPWTLPSHGSMFTGTLPHEQSGAWMAPIDAAHPTLAEVLSRSGYLTAGFVANSSYGGAAFGLARGFTHYEDKRLSVGSVLTRAAFMDVVFKVLPHQLLTPDALNRKLASSVTDSFLEWSAARDQSKPYFAFLNYFDAHSTYQAPREFATRFVANGRRPRANVWERSLDTWGAADQREFRDAYDGAVAYIDDAVGRLLAVLEQRGDLSKTLVIITSDHGEQFGEHGLMEHSNSLYLTLLHVPLIVVFPPQVPADRRVDGFVSLRDLASTVLDLTGRNSGELPGETLAAFWRSEGRAERRPVVSEVDRSFEAYPASYPARRGRMQSVAFGEYHYIVNLGTHQEELYRPSQDAAEARDLSTTAPDVMRRYRAYLESAVPSRATSMRPEPPCPSPGASPAAAPCATVLASRSSATSRQR